MAEQSPIRMQVHGSEDRRIDGILTLIEESSRVAPLGDVLQRMCEQVAQIAHAEVVSVYTRELEDGRPVFVLRANVGFPREMIGNVKLELGEGITGFAAECLRPVSAEIAQRDSHYKHFPELGEERFPSFLSIPLVMGGQAAGVLNLQRAEGGDFSSAEVALAAALATPFAFAIDRSQSRGDDRPVDSGRSARLTGKGLGKGFAIGRAQSESAFQALREPSGPGPAARDAVRAAVSRVADAIARTLGKLDERLSPEDRRGLAALQFTLQDQRLLSLIDHSCLELGVVAGLRKVARDYVAVPYMVGDGNAVDPWLSARAGEIEDLCLWIGHEATGDAGANPGSIAVFAERLGTFAVIASIVRGVSGFVIGAEVPLPSLGAALAQAAGLPIVAEVAGLFAWVRGGDTVIVDASQSLVRVNPSPSVLAHYRHVRGGK